MILKEYNGKQYLVGWRRSSGGNFVNAFVARAYRVPSFVTKLTGIEHVTGNETYEHSVYASNFENFDDEQIVVFLETGFKEWTQVKTKVSFKKKKGKIHKMKWRNP